MFSFSFLLSPPKKRIVSSHSESSADLLSNNTRKKQDMDSILYFETLQFQAMELSLSYTTSRASKQESRTLQIPKNPFFQILLNAFGMNLKSIEDAPIKLNAIEILRCVVSKRMLFDLTVSPFIYLFFKKVITIIDNDIVNPLLRSRNSTTLFNIWFN